MTDRKLNYYLTQRDPVRAAVSMADKQAVAKTLIDRQAGIQRGRFITVAPGQDMVYLQKQGEALAYLAAGSPAGLTAYPLLAARAAATGQAPTDVATEWAARATAWSAIAAQIETAREGAKSAIGIATTEAEIYAILAGLVWPV